MARRGRVNWILLIVVLVGGAALAVTFVGLRTWHRTHRSQVGFARGTEAYEQKDWSDAAMYLGQYLSVNPRDVDTLLKYADAALKIRPLKRSNIEQVIRAYNQILRIEDNEKAATLLLELYLQSGNTSEVISQARNFLSRKENLQVRQLLAESYIQQKNYAEAEEQIQTILKGDPANIEAYQLMSMLAREAPGITDKTPMEWLDEGVKVNPNHPRPYLFRAAYAQQKNQAPQAQEDLKKAESLQFEKTDDRLRLATLLLMQKELDRAEFQIQNILDLEPDNLMAWKLQAKWASGLHESDVLIQTARQGLDALKKDSFDFLPQAAELFIQAQAFDEAQKCIQQLYELQPDSPSISLLKGLLAESQQQWSAAVHEWRSLASSPQKSEMIQARLAYCLDRMGDPIAAIQEYHNLELMNPDSAEAHRQLARLFSEQGRLQEALEQARQAASLLPDDPEIQTLLVKLHLMSAANSPNVQSLNVLKDQISEMKNDQERIEMQVLLVRNEISRQMFEEAGSDLENLTNQIGQTLQTRRLQAELLAAQDKTQEADAAYQSLIADFPESMEALSSIIIFYMDQDNLQQANMVLSEALKRFSNPINRKRIVFWLSETDWLMGNFQRAVERLTELAGQYPNDTQIYSQLLKIDRQDAPVERLQGWIDQIKAIEGPSGRQYRLEQAYLWYERGNFQQDYPRIVSLLGEVLRDYPDDRSSRVLLAASHQKAGNLQLAATAYREALQRDPDNLDLISATVNVLYQVEDYRQAEEILSRSAGLGIQDSRLSQLQVKRLLKEGKYSPAGDILETMLKQSPENAQIKITLAMIKLYNNEIEAADKLLDEILRDNPGFFPAVAARVEARLREGQTDLAIEICNQAIADSKSPSTLSLRALTYAKTGHSKEASEDIDQMIELFGSTPENLVRACDLYQLLGETKRAQNLIEKALEQKPDDLTILKKATFLYSRTLGNQQQTQDLLTRALTMSPGDADLRLLKAGFLFREASKESIDEAVDILNKLVYEYPRLESAWVTLADWTLRQGQTGKAMDQIYQGLGFLPKSKSLLMLKAKVESQRSMNLALPTLKLLYNIDPLDGRVVAQLARGYMETDQTKQALELLEKSRQQPNMKQVYFINSVLVPVLYQSGKKEEAGRLYAEAIKNPIIRSGLLIQWIQTLLLDKQWQQVTDVLTDTAEQYPDEITVIADLTLRFCMQDDPKAQKSSEDLLKYLEMTYPDKEEIPLISARLYHSTGQIDQAVKYYQKVLQLNPDQTTALNNLSWILCKEEKDCQKALQMADYGLKINPQDLDLLDTRGEICYSLGMYERAAEDLEKAVRLYKADSPEKTKSCFRLVRTLAKLGQKEQTQAFLKLALDLNRSSKALTDEQKQELDLISNELLLQQ